MIVTVDFISRRINKIVRRLWNPSYTLLIVMSLPFRKHFTNLSMGKHKLDFHIFTVKIAVEIKRNKHEFQEIPCQLPNNKRKYHIQLMCKNTGSKIWKLPMEFHRDALKSWMHFLLSMKLGRDWLENSA